MFGEVIMWENYWNCWKLLFFQHFMICSVWKKVAVAFNDQPSLTWPGGPAAIQLRCFSVKTFRGCNKVFTPREPSKMDEMRLHGLALKLQVDCIDWFLIHVYFVVTQVEHLISILSIRSCLNPEIYDEVWGVKENRTSPIAVMLKLSSVWLHVLKLTIFKMFLGLSRSYQESLVVISSGIGVCMTNIYSSAEDFLKWVCLSRNGRLSNLHLSLAPPKNVIHDPQKEKNLQPSWIKWNIPHFHLWI